MRIIYVTTIGSTMGFFRSIIRELLDEGHTVELAANEDLGKVPDCYRDWGCKVHHHSCTRSPFHRGTLAAIREIRRIVREGDYDIVHCHTPIAAMCTRLACRKERKKGLKVFYTAHGFHFYRGAPLKNWLLYYPAEWLCAHWTDTLITINREDCGRAEKHLHAKRVEYVPGVGIDVEKFADVKTDRAKKRRELGALGAAEDAFLLLSVGELNENKNHETVLRAMAQLKNGHIRYAIVGSGERKEYLSDLARALGIETQLRLMGHRDDMPELYKAADAYVHPSLREGLPVALMEAAASGLPCIVSRIRGNTDVVTEEDALCDPRDADAFAAAIDRFYRELPPKRDAAHIQRFSLETVNAKMREIYGVR